MTQQTEPRTRRVSVVSAERVTMRVTARITTRTSARGIALIVASALVVAMLMAPRVVRADAEAPDATRLDVERLPPEAIAITRDMYRTGLHIVAELGGAGFAGGAGRISTPGPAARAGVGYELTPWFSLSGVVGMSFHATDAPPPPAPSAFQVYSLLAQAKLQAALGSRVALFLAGEAGAGWASGDFLQSYGFADAGKLGFVYGGRLGVDWHLLNAHHSLGLCAGAHLYPNLDSPSGEHAISIESAAYMKYVF